MSTEAKPIPVPVNIEDEMRRSYLDYAMSVIIGRALPDARDGLKPVQRRILYGMHEMGLHFGRVYRKCAKIVGEVMGNYHPHGDVPLYDSLVRMAQDFSMRYAVIDGQGNFGSVDGDPPAAMRYTEARLAQITDELLADIEKETVDFSPNYDESTVEPDCLPTKIPNLLANGASGIAVGMATNIPPHNLNELLEASILLIQKPNTGLDEIMKIVPGPDFPTGGFISGKEGIRQAYENGRGSFQVRAKASIERVTKDKERIVITEIPFQVNKAKLIERIAELVQEKKIDGVADIRDESDREGMRIVLDLRRDEQPQIILNNLYKHTQMQMSFGVIMLAIVNGQPRELGLVDALKLFIDHRVDVVRRRTQYDLRKAEQREHILLGYKKALEHLDAIIKLIRASKSPAEAKVGLVARFDLTEIQAQAILDLQLHRLTQMERQKILDELAEIQKKIAEYKEILASEKVLRTVIVKELREVQKEFGDPRRTQIVERVEEIKLEDLIPDEDVAIALTHSGYLKRTPVTTYRHQGRGGKGRLGMKTREEDFVEYLFVASTHSYILVFANTGRVYWLKVWDIPEVGAAGRGKSILNLVNMSSSEKVAAVLSVRNLEEEGMCVVMVTRRGTIKKTELTEYSHPRSSGIIGISLEKGDELIAARITDSREMIFLASREGQAILFPETEVRAMGRQAYGVIGMDLDKNDYLVGAEVIELDWNAIQKALKKKPESLDDVPNEVLKQALPVLMLTVTENGYGKRTPLEEYRIQSRGGKGVISVKTTERNGNVVSILPVTEESDVMVITQQGKLIRVHAAEIREAGRSTQGVRLLRLEPGDRVAAACRVPEEEEEPSGEAPPAQ